MDLQQIRNFLILAEELHFWKSASMVNLTQSALSRQIMSLEQELGCSLFERNKRNVKLTPAGVFLKEKWSVLLDDLSYVHVFARNIGAGENGIVRIVHPDSVSYSVIPTVLLHISRDYPDLTIELIQLLHENAQESLRDYKIDVAFTRQINVLPGISSYKIKSEPVAFFVQTAHPYINFSDITGENLANQSFIMPVEDRKSSYFFLVQQIFTSYGVVPRSNYQSDFGSSILGLVSKGLGIALLPIGFAKHKIEGVRYFETPFTTDLYINWRTNENSPAVLNVLKTIESVNLIDENLKSEI